MVAEEGAHHRQQHKEEEDGKAKPAGQQAGAGGGSIVMVSAAVASHGLPNYSAMSAAKAAVEGACGVRGVGFNDRHK
jgi:NAD(P)-dependent dehydrogenase (short-subunit alcohol dehydrogenase family)